MAMDRQKSEDEIGGSVPCYGEVWRLRDGAEGDATALRLIVSTDALGRLPWRMVAPLRSDEKRPSGLWEVATGTLHDSSLDGGFIVDAARLGSVDCSECDHRVGRLGAELMAEVVAAIAILVEAE